MVDSSAIRYRAEETFALAMDASDPLASYRERFHHPLSGDGRPVIYLAGNSLGLQPVAARTFVEREMDEWARLGVDGHMRGSTPWYSYHEIFRESGARLVGATPDEVVTMNSLTVNLHLLMATFYRPTPPRHKILVEHRAFPSDLYAVQTQLRHHGYDPETAMLTAAPRAGEHEIRAEDLEALLEERGEEIALVLLGGVNYFTGQLFDMKRITEAGHERGCVVGWDLAHAAGNVILRLHDWDVDFAAWCSYKYLNGGPGAVAGAFVHERHARDISLPRLGGWWGNDPATRFRMDSQTRFVPSDGADGWQVSNPPVLAMAPLRASFELFDEVGIEVLRDKSVRLTGYLLYLIDREAERRFEVITPRRPEERGCQLSLRVCERPRELFADLVAEGAVGDFREPDVIRVAPVPFYNTFHEVWKLGRIIGRK